ncbi:hypothetical protein D027_4495A, partial [Vibrio parahaemolyticus 861]
MHGVSENMHVRLCP